MSDQRNHGTAALVEELLHQGESITDQLNSGKDWIYLTQDRVVLALGDGSLIEFGKRYVASMDYVIARFRGVVWALSVLAVVMALLFEELVAFFERQGENMALSLIALAAIGAIVMWMLKKEKIRFHITGRADPVELQEISWRGSDPRLFPLLRQLREHLE